MSTANKPELVFTSVLRRGAGFIEVFSLKHINIEKVLTRMFQIPLFFTKFFMIFINHPPYSSLSFQGFRDVVHTAINAATTRAEEEPKENNINPSSDGDPWVFNSIASGVDESLLFSSPDDGISDMDRVMLIAKASEMTCIDPFIGRSI